LLGAVSPSPDRRRRGRTAAPTTWSRTPEGTVRWVTSGAVTSGPAARPAAADRERRALAFDPGVGWRTGTVITRTRRRGPARSRRSRRPRGGDPVVDGEGTRPAPQRPSGTRKNGWLRQRRGRREKPARTTVTER